MFRVGADVLSAYFETMGHLANGTGRSRAFRTAIKEHGIVVDTTIAYDTDTWETGVSRDGGGSDWTIVEQYTDEDAAAKGHKAWVAKLRKKPKTKLVDMNLWDLQLEDD